MPVSSGCKGSQRAKLAESLLRRDMVRCLPIPEAEEGALSQWNGCQSVQRATWTLSADVWTAGGVGVGASPNLNEVACGAS